MKIFNWLHNKITRRRKPNSVSSPRRHHCKPLFTPQQRLHFTRSISNQLCHELQLQGAKEQEEKREEFSELLLLIGTFGNNEPQQINELATASTSVDQQLQHNGDDLMLLHFKDSNNKEISPRARGAAIGKTMLSFLLGNMFVCKDGIAIAPNIKDHIQESRLMDKFILRAILQNKIHPRPQSQSTLSGKKCLEMSSRRHDITEEQIQHGSKWVKTDSEYIVLEI